MKVYIVIPFHNEEAHLELMLTSLVKQSKHPEKVVLVNDNSTDRSTSIAQHFATTHSWINVITQTSSDAHLPGTKVINAFYTGLQALDDNYDIICKFDADIILPGNYLQTIINHFKAHPSSGIVGGHLYIEKSGQWLYENIASKDHVRGPIKAYRKSCFEDIGGLRNVIGWDTIDVLLAQFYSWEVHTISTLQVKHLKPTGTSYSKQAQLLSGERWYQMRYGLALTIIASAKSAIKAKSIRLFMNSIKGYLKASNKKIIPAVTDEEGQFIRKLRWSGIRQKFF